jgi:transcriptional regulator with XRE-family HTH domain
VEQFEQIRRDRDREGLSIRALADRHGVHRRAVRQALQSAVPPLKARGGVAAGAEVGPVSGGDRCVA